MMSWLLFFFMLSQKIKDYFSFKTLFATVVVSSGWGWYHFSKHPKWIFAGKVVLLWIVVVFGWLFAKKVYQLLAKKMGAHPFWTTDFYKSFDTLFLILSLLFGIYFFTNEIFSLVWGLCVFTVLFRFLQTQFAKHPRALGLLKINRAYFTLGGFLFITQALSQYTAYHYYILDSNVRFFNIVFFRVVAMTIFWLAGFALASLMYIKIKNVLRWSWFVIWSLLFTLELAISATNVAILYYSGLYLSPVAVGHAAGAGSVLINSLTIFLVAVLVVVLVFFVTFLRSFIRAQRLVDRSFVLVYGGTFTLAGLLIVVGLSSFRNTPESVMVKSFYDFYFGKTVQITLDPAIKVKLATFGLRYNTDAFYVSEQPQVFAPTSTLLLPKRFEKNKPNVVLVYVESFSARFSGAYNPKLSGVTPNFDAFAADPDTTVFRNYFNASTPTITGSLSQLCSFLPPTGHNEIQNERKLQNHHLLCLPEILKKYAGFKYTNYVTAVDKEFAHKDGIFTSMGVDKIYGTDELAEYISGKPLSWGYSDHQLFPALFNFMKTAPQPFLMTLATVDTHPPFNLAQDAVNYGDGTQPVLNMFHTTDDAFGGFWKDFKQSPFYKNTMVVVVADHAIFPGAITQDIFPNEAGKLTYYDENYFAMYIPDNVLPREMRVFSSGIDQLPTILQIFNINIPNSFEGRSIFDDRSRYPNLLGMHELGLYINQIDKNGKRSIEYNVPTEIVCDKGYVSSSTPAFTLCDYLQFFHWKRLMFEQGRFWKRSN